MSTVSSPRSTRATSSDSCSASLRTNRSMPRTPRCSSAGAGIHTVVLTTTPPSRTRPASVANSSGSDRGEVEQYVDRLGHRCGHVGGGVVDDLVGAVLDEAAAAARAAGGDDVGVRRPWPVARRSRPRPRRHRRSGSAARAASSACSNSACHAVRPTSGNAAASASGMLVGAAARASAGTSTKSAEAPSATNGRKPMTRSPTARSSTSSPTRVDRSGDVQSEDVRQGQRHRALHEAGADVGVDAVERGRGHADPHLTGTGDWGVDVLVTQDLRSAVLVEHNCLHVRSLPRVRVCASNPKHSAT